jgi:HSP20 family protein
MTNSGKIAKREERQLGYMDEIFENFRSELESVLKPWHGRFTFPSVLDVGARVPLYDMKNKGDRYELQIEVPGIEKDKVNINATRNYVEVSAEQSEKKEEKKKDYVYSERSSSSFYRKIPVPEEIIPSKVDARMNNGILIVQLPKKSPKKSEETKKVEVK